MLVRILVLTSLLPFGCFQEYSQENLPCPCKDGWKCCSYKCIPEQYICTPGDGGSESGDPRAGEPLEDGEKRRGDGGCASDGDLAGSDRGCCVYDSDCPVEHLCRDGICVPNQGDGGVFHDDGGSDVLIASRSSGCGMGGSPSNDQVAIYLAHGMNPDDCHVLIGQDTPHSGPGTTIYDSDNEPGFDDFVVCLTNGIDEYMLEEVMFFQTSNGAGRQFNESEFWHRSPDFKGCTITRIRHVISALTITFNSGGANVDGEWVWEVWGRCGGG